MHSHKNARHSPKVIKSDFKALGQFLRESEPQVILISVLPGAGNSIDRKQMDLVTGVTTQIWCSLIMGWPTQHQTC